LSFETGLELGVDRFLEFFFVRLISCGMARIDRRKGVRDMLRDGFRNNRVDHEVRITHRVDIAGRASERRWDFQKPDPLRRFHPSRLSDFDFWIARILQEWREPTDLEFRSAIDQHIGFAQFDDETGPRIDEMRVLGRLGEDGDVDILTTDLTREGSVVG